MALLNKIRAAITQPVEKNEQPVVKLYISPFDNEWNKLAIQLVRQSEALPSQRQKVICYKPVQRREGLPKHYVMSTNEWNIKALSSAEEEPRICQQKT